MNDDSKLDLDTVLVLINQARDGVQSARSDLARQVQNYLSIMADKKLNRAVRPNLNPSDIVQQTLIRMVDGIDNFRGQSTEEFYGWLNQIISNESAKANRDFTRQKRDVRRQQSLSDMDSVSRLMQEPSDANPTPGANAVSQERIELFHETLGKLPEDYATVIRLRNLEQLPFKDVAEKMGRSVDAVSKLWYRAVVKFQHELEQLEDHSR